MSSIVAVFSPYSDRICMCLDVILNYFLNVIVWISEFFAALPMSLVTTTHPNALQIILYYIMILLLVYFFKISRKFIIVIFLFLVISSIIHLPDNNFRVITFDVQNADCFLIKTPKSKYFIVDTGRAGFRGGKSQANSIIIKYLKDNGIKNIEGLIITHFDNDHSGGAVDIINSVNVKKVYVNSFNDKSMTSINIYKTLKQQGISTFVPTNNEILYKEDNLVLKAFISNLDEDNEKSIISLFSYNDFDILFMGDAGVRAFESLNTIPSNVEVLKVGHHGGANVVNSKMIEYLNPQVSIISTGTNFFGHPNKGTLDILRNTNIYRTDIHNSIEVVSDGKKYSVNLFDTQKRKYVKFADYKI